MLKNSFRIASPFPAVWMLVLLLLLWWPFIWNSTAVETTDTAPLFQWWVENVIVFPRLLNLLSVFILFAAGIVISRLFNQHRLLQEASQLPAFLFLLLWSLDPDLMRNTPLIWSLPFMLLGLRRLFVVYNQNKVYGHFFYAAFFFGLASLLYLPLIGFLGLVFVVTFIFRPFEWRNYVVSLIGFSLPLIYAAVICLLIGKQDFWVDWMNSGWHPINWELGISFYLLLIYLLLVLMISVALFVTHYSKSVVRVKNLLLVLLWFLVPAIAVIFFPWGGLGGSILLMAVPLSLLFAHTFLSLRKRWLANLLFVSLLLLLLYHHYQTFFV